MFEALLCAALINPFVHRCLDGRNKPFMICDLTRTRSDTPKAFAHHGRQAAGIERQLRQTDKTFYLFPAAFFLAAQRAFII